MGYLKELQKKWSHFTDLAAKTISLAPKGNILIRSCCQERVSMVFSVSMTILGVESCKWHLLRCLFYRCFGEPHHIE